MGTKKYILTEATKEYLGITLYRIKAIRAFGDIKEGDIGGWIESEINLSHAGNAWVYSNAIVYGNARVFGNARIDDNSKVYDNAKIYGDAEVYDNAKVYGNAWVSDNAKVSITAEVYGNTWVRENAGVYGNARVYGNASINGSAWICGNAYVCNDTDYIVFKNWWSSCRHFTWTRSNNKWKVGCFYGTGEELIQKAYADSEKSGREYERVVKYVESILADEKEDSKHN